MSTNKYVLSLLSKLRQLDVFNRKCSPFKRLLWKYICNLIFHMFAILILPKRVRPNQLLPVVILYHNESNYRLDLMVGTSGSLQGAYLITARVRDVPFTDFCSETRFTGNCLNN